MFSLDITSLYALVLGIILLSRIRRKMPPTAAPSRPRPWGTTPWKATRLSENSEFVHGRCCQVLPMSPVYTSHLPLGMLKPRFNVAKSSPPPFVPDSHFTRLTTGSERRVRKEPEGSVHSEENGWPLSHRRKPLGGLAIGTPSFYQNHWVLFAKALGGFPKTIGC